MLQGTLAKPAGSLLPSSSGAVIGTGAGILEVVGDSAVPVGTVDGASGPAAYHDGETWSPPDL